MCVVCLGGEMGDGWISEVVQHCYHFYHKKISHATTELYIIHVKLTEQ